MPERPVVRMLQPEPEHPMDVVVSVAHSGTRSLRDYLGLRAHYHFEHRPTRVTRWDEDRLHIPIRNPMDVAASWAKRGKPLDKLLESYGFMFKYMRSSPANGYTLYHMEEMPYLAGMDDNKHQRWPKAKDPEEFKMVVTQAVVIPHWDFFSHYYGNACMQELH